MKKAFTFASIDAILKAVEATSTPVCNGLNSCGSIKCQKITTPPVVTGPFPGYCTNSWTTDGIKYDFK